MMKKILFICLSCTLWACSNVEQLAEQKLQAARTAYEQGKYNEAKLLIDSIKILYPKAYKTRRAGIGLMQEVELKEQERTVAYLDSLLHEKQTAFNKIKGKFVFEKDEEYQTIGNYLHPSQVIEKNLNRSFLRFQVNELGVMSMTSIYCGSRNIHHTAVKVSANDNFAETPPSTDSYETSDLGIQIEKADYKMGKDGNVIGFITLNKDKNIRVDYIGERPYTTNMTSNDRQAAASLYELSQILTAITQINEEKKEANLKIQFVKKKMEERKQKEAVQE
ncbi:MAG: hypothetical protein E7099_03010 [Mediterranea massiliensis]|nr:hypothetical protein [Mediterranea massiliensis]